MASSTRRAGEDTRPWRFQLRFFRWLRKRQGCQDDFPDGKTKRSLLNLKGSIFHDGKTIVRSGISSKMKRILSNERSKNAFGCRKRKVWCVLRWISIFLSSCFFWSVSMKQYFLKVVCRKEFRVSYISDLSVLSKTIFVFYTIFWSHPPENISST